MNIQNHYGKKIITSLKDSSRKQKVQGEELTGSIFHFYRKSTGSPWAANRQFFLGPPLDENEYSGS
jgi:hypothetical protein